MRISWHPLAKFDLQEAAGWYDSQESGLGDEFAIAVDNAVQCIADFGETFSVDDLIDQIRVCPMTRFPCHINFRILDDEAQILCVKHNRRHPDYGTDR